MYVQGTAAKTPTNDSAERDEHQWYFVLRYRGAVVEARPAAGVASVMASRKKMRLDFDWRMVTSENLRS